MKNKLKVQKDHAYKIRDSGYKNTIYCLLINERSVKDNEIKDCLIKAQKKCLNQNIYFTSMSMDEFSELGITLEHDFRNSAKNIPSISLEKCFQDCANSLYEEDYLSLNDLILETVSSINMNSE